MKSLVPIKRKLKQFRGLFGDELLDIYALQNAETIEDINAILDKQVSHYEDMMTDAINRFELFRKSLNIDN